MPEQPSHFWIPAARARIEPVIVQARGDSYIREDLASHSTSLRTAFVRSMELFVDKHDLDLATELIVEISTTADRPISKERQHLRNLGFEIISLSPDAPNVAIARIQRTDLPRLTRRIDRYAATPRHIGKGNLAAIDGIAPVAVTRKLDSALAAIAEESATACLITLYSSLPAEMKRTVADRIANQLREQGKPSVDVHTYVNGSVGVTAALTRVEMEQVGEQFIFVRCIESNADVVMESAVQADPVPTIVQIDSVRCQSPVVVIDSGVNASCTLFAGLVRRTVDELPAGSVGPHLAHGTFVASRVVYGDDITVILTRRATPWCPVIDVQVTGKDGAGNRIPQSAAKLAEVIQRIVPQLAGEAKVYNLSLGIAPISDGFYSSLARLIDFLSREHGVLFVIAAGNITEPTAAPPRHYLPATARILVPAESLLALTVGAMARFCEPNCVAREGEISPFSRRGPGADAARKPELVAHGGNAFFDGLGWVTSPRTAAYGLGSLGTHLEYSIGTSYAAPLVAQYAARLFDAYPDATPNLVRALLCHFTRPVLTPTPGPPIEDEDFCGFGEPIVERAMFSPVGSASFLFQGTIQSNTFLYLPFHVPQALVDELGSSLTIRGTVVFDPPVSPDDSLNYSLCRVSGLLRKRGENGMHDVAIGGLDSDARIPWNPLLHFQHRFKRPYASGEWELRLRLMTRGDLPDTFAQSFSVVIEVLDTRGLVDVRAAIANEVPGIYTPVLLQLAA